MDKLNLKNLEFIGIKKWHYKLRAPNDALRNLFISNHSNCTGHKEMYSQQMDSFSVYWSDGNTLNSFTLSFTSVVVTGNVVYKIHFNFLHNMTSVKGTCNIPDHVLLVESKWQSGFNGF